MAILLIACGFPITPFELRLRLVQTALSPTCLGRLYLFCSRPDFLRGLNRSGNSVHSQFPEARLPEPDCGPYAVRGRATCFDWKPQSVAPVNASSGRRCFAT